MFSPGSQENAETLKHQCRGCGHHDRCREVFVRLEHEQGAAAMLSIAGLLVPLLVFAAVATVVSNFFAALAGRAGGSVLSLACGLAAAMLWIVAASALIRRRRSSKLK